jgi:uncharacterized membrane protein YdjX (TVP38/TMEM64 family)
MLKLVNFSRQKIALVLALLLLAGVFFLLDLHSYLNFEAIKGYQGEAQDFYQQRPLLALVGFFLIYLVLVGLSLPGGALLGLLAGAVFGVLAGTVVVSFASTIAATLACALSRYLLRDPVKARFPLVLATVDRGMEREGAFYLFSLRLIPAVPFFAINLVMGLTSIRLGTYYWISQLGMLPGTLVFVNAGNELGRLTSPAGIFSPRLLLAFALLGLLPLIAKRLLAFCRSRGQLYPGDPLPAVSPPSKAPPAGPTRPKL